MMDETDIVTGRHLKKIPKAVKEICDCCEKKPSVVMICITCVDALLGTDMERVCRKAEEKVDIPVRPCYMYALTREGRKPPMVHVRQSLYSLLEHRRKREMWSIFWDFFRRWLMTARFMSCCSRQGKLLSMFISIFL